VNYMLETQHVPPMKYPRVCIWRDGYAVVKSDSVTELMMYPHIVKRVLYRRFGGDRFSMTIYWEGGAWSSVCVSPRMLLALLKTGVNYGWPRPELI
jgi:hypothetical protein